MRCIKNSKILLLIIVLIYDIISINNSVNATGTNVEYKTVSYTISGPINVEPYQYSIWTDAIKFHIDANGYNSKYGDNCTNNFLVYNPELSAERKAKGYGQYTYKLKALKEFIEYCYTQNQSHTNACATITGATENDSCNYTKLVNLSQSTISGKTRQFMSTFWSGMLSLGNTFNEYQDSYFFKTNTLNAIEKIQGTLNSEGLEAGGLTIENLSSNKKSNAYALQSSKEYLTILTTYMYSINKEEKLASVGKGDLVPFLYYAEHTDETDPYEIGKYAYIALMNEFLKISGTNYWQPEFDYVYFNGGGFTDRELYEEDGRPDLETLEQWYDETYEKYKNDRGAKQNPLIGSDPDTIISSNYTISYQVEAMKNYVQDIYTELGIDMNVDDFIAKNELMAKYMMESSKLDDTIKDYNVSIKFVEENLQRGTYIEENTSTAVLSDMQVLTFNHTLDNDGQSDGDNISDKNELGSISKIDITGFAEKMYSSKHNGNMSGYETEIDRIVKNNGYNPEIPNSGHVIKEKDANGNIKVYYRVYNYTSNPMLIDTDFDGINDNNDSIKKDNNFKGNTGKIGNIEYNNDFRYFYINNKKYNDELSTMSLMMSNLANGESISTNQVNGNISEYLTKLCFPDTDRRTKSAFRISDTETINGRLYLAKKTIQTGASSVADRRYKDVYGIFLGKFDSIDNYKKLITNFNDEEIRTYYGNIVTDCINFIRANRAETTNDYCYWICGYGISGTIAAEVANELVKDSEVFCYTFGATSGNGSSGVNREIKNVLNEDDLIPKLNNHNDGFGRSGIVVNDSIYDNFIVEYKQITGSDKYEAKHKRANSLKQLIVDAKDINDEYYRNIIEEYLSRILYNYQNIIEPFIISTNTKLFSALNANIRKIKQGHEIKSYYVLSKSLDGYAENNSNSTWGYMDIDFDSFEDIYTYDDGDNTDLVETIMSLADWYVNHIPTYQHKSEVHKDDGSLKTNYYNNATQDARDYFENNGGSYETRHGIGHREETDPITHLPVIINVPYTYRYPIVANDSTGTNAILHISDNRIGYRNDDLVNYANNKNDQVGTSQYAGYGGDDCNSFAMGVVRLDAEGDRGQNTNRSNRLASTGMQLQNTSSGMMQTNDNFEAAMINLGYDKYAYRGNRWVKFENNNGTIIQRPLTEVMGNASFTMSINFLEPGDMLIKNGHVEFYLGYINAHRNDAQSEDDYEWMRVNDLTPEYREYNDYMTENSQTHIITDNRQTRAYSTFGWGRVHNQCPEGGNYFSYSGHSFSLGSDSGYDVIFRKDR